MCALSVQYPTIQPNVMIKQPQKGFTLIEVMVTMVIASVGLLAMASLLITSIKVNASSERRMDAAMLAQSVMMQTVVHVRTLAAGHTAGLAPGEATALAITMLGGKYDADGKNGGYAPTVTFVRGGSSETATGEFTSVTVKLDWYDHGDTKSVTLRSGGYTE
jgi:prepilin-type N-terminal cleavage/methylation domain-containing protein